MKLNVSTAIISFFVEILVVCVALIFSYCSPVNGSGETIRCLCRRLRQYMLGARNWSHSAIVIGIAALIAVLVGCLWEVLALIALGILLLYSDKQSKNNTQSPYAADPVHVIVEAMFKVLSENSKAFPILPPHGIGELGVRVCTYRGITAVVIRVLSDGAPSTQQQAELFKGRLNAFILSYLRQGSFINVNRPSENGHDALFKVETVAHSPDSLYWNLVVLPGTAHFSSTPSTNKKTDPDF